MTPLTELLFKPKGWWRRVWQTILVLAGLAGIGTGLVWWVWHG